MREEKPNTDNWNDYVMTERGAQYQILEITYESAFNLIEMYLNEEELRDAVEQSLVWDDYKDSVGAIEDLSDPEVVARMPKVALKTLSDFGEWYCRKIDCHKHGYIMLVINAKGAANSVARSEYPSIRSEETKTRLANSVNSLIFKEAH